MGTTLFTLHIFGGIMDEVSALLKPAESIRTQNTPWLSIVPSWEEIDYGAKHLVALARKQARPCILFCYMDDDYFLIQLYLNGKSAGHIHSLGGTSRLAGFSNVLNGGDYRELKQISKCLDINEALTLAEELLGTALYDFPDAEPRRIPRSRRALEAILAREKAIRSRPNRYRLAKVDRESMPPAIEARMRVMDSLRESGVRSLASTILYGLAGSCWAGAKEKNAIAFSYLRLNRQGSEEYTAVVDLAENRIQEVHTDLRCGPVIGLSGGKYPILPCFAPSGGGYGSVVCLNPDGSIRWRFASARSLDDRIEVWAPGLPGTLGVFTSLTGDNTIIWLISTDDGRILAQNTLPGMEDLRRLQRWEEKHAFIFYSPERRAFVLLNDDLSFRGEIPAGEHKRRFDLSTVRIGSEVWLQCISTGDIEIFNLEDGSLRRIHPDIPGYFHSVFPDGRICMHSQTGGTVILLDHEGRLLSRLRLKGSMAGVIHRGNENLLVETNLEADERSPAEDLIRVWRVEPK